MQKQKHSPSPFVLPSDEEGGAAYPFMQPVRRRKLVDEVYEGLLEAIITGHLTSGQDLNELAIARQLNVSRTPVHEAILRLLGDGLAEQRSSGRARVIQFTRGHVLSIYEMRKILEGAAAHAAASRIHQDTLSRLRAESEDWVHAPRDKGWMTWAVRWDLELHEAVAHAAGNPYLRQEILRFRRLVQGFCRVTGTLEVLQTAYAEHLGLLVALEERDGEKARRLMVEHIENRLQRVLRVMDEANTTEGGTPPLAAHA